MYPVKDEHTNLWGYRNQSDWLIKPQFKYANPFHSGIAVVMTETSDAFLRGRDEIITVEQVVGVAAKAFGFVGADNRSASTCLVRARESYDWWIVDQQLNAMVIRLPKIMCRESIQKIGRILLLSEYANSKWSYHFHDQERSLTTDSPFFGTSVSVGDWWGVSLIADVSEWRYFDTNAFDLIGPTFQWANGFEGQHASVKMNEKWHVVNREFKPLFNLRFDYVSPYENGLAVAWSDDGCGYLSSQGDFIALADYQDIEPVNAHGMAIAVRNNQKRSIDIIKPSGEVLASGFESACFVNGDFPYFEITRNGRMEILDLNFQAIGSWSESG